MCNVVLIAHSFYFVENPHFNVLPKSFTKKNIMFVSMHFPGVVLPTDLNPLHAWVGYDTRELKFIGFARNKKYINANCVSKPIIRESQFVRVFFLYRTQLPKVLLIFVRAL